MGGGVCTCISTVCIHYSVYTPDTYTTVYIYVYVCVYTLISRSSFVSMAHPVMLSRQQLLHLFNEFAVLVSKPGKKQT